MPNDGRQDTGVDSVGSEYRIGERQVGSIGWIIKQNGAIPRNAPFSGGGFFVFTLGHFTAG